MDATKTAPRVVVVGSINLDLVLRCAEFPKPGETVPALGYDQIPGGKGANQAVAAARAGAAVAMLGRVGDDAFGQRLVESLAASGVECSTVLRTPNCPSGLAFINVDQQGQNTIVIVGGANAQLSPADVQQLAAVIAGSSAVMLQLEIPLETVLTVIRIAKQANVRVLLDPAPAPRTFPEELLDVDLICPNEQEAAQLSGLPVRNLIEVEAAARALHGRGARQVVITLGAQGAYVYDGNGGRLVPSFATEVVDTTAAGDAFSGALAVRWAETNDLDEAVLWGNAAGAIAASRHGAQPSLGTRTEIEQLRRSRS